MIVTGPALDVKIESALDGLPSDEAILIPLYEGYESAAVGFLSVLNQPRCLGEAADLLVDECQRVDDIKIAIGNKLKALQSVKKGWRAPLMAILARHEVFIGRNEAEVLKALGNANALPETKERTH